MAVLLRRLALLIVAAVVVFPAVPVCAHSLTVGSSKWCFGKNNIIGNIDLGPTLLSELQGIKEKEYDPGASTDEELQRIAATVLQPYLNRKLTITVNGTSYPVKVDRLVRNNNLFTIGLSVSNVAYRNGANDVRIDYRLLFDETGNTHMNLAYMYLTDATGSDLQKIFDFSQPAGQYNFDAGNHAWDLSFQRSAPAVANERKISTSEGTGVAAVPVKRDSSGKEGSHPAPHGGTAPVPASSSASARGPAGAGTPAPAPAAVASQSPVKVVGNSTPSIWSNFTRFLLLGVEHILTGYDHMAFLVALIVIGLSIREVLKIITAFTVAHSITLLLAALQIVSLNSRFVESAIALSICYVALENLFRKKIRYRWLVTFGFGLIHGFGFASALQELIVGKSNLVLSVLSFNLGVEAGQLMIFVLLLPVLHLMKRKLEFRMVTVGASMAVFVLGFTWLVERIFDLKLLPV